MKLLFVYNANAGIAAGIMDSIHKTLSPATYPCDLCAITYGAVRMDPKWKAWLKAQPFESSFIYRAEFRQRFPDNDAVLPAIFVVQDDQPALLVAASDFKQTPSVDALIALIETRLS